ncbi:hypothetical protein B0H63DRAFT_288815 [Podospora didyma]|uniref:Protein kinase domain-containing protein n=1 Tax=Podospora didyma TaxID=330526 RepID=A0AAE0N6J2_9PEZI|nr:hypothetical protein B0H63DRAFT_288815 [Podospora didyma]
MSPVLEATAMMVVTPRLSSNDTRKPTLRVNICPNSGTIYGYQPPTLYLIRDGEERVLHDDPLLDYSNAGLIASATVSYPQGNIYRLAPHHQLIRYEYKAYDLREAILSLTLEEKMFIFCHLLREIDQLHSHMGFHGAICPQQILVAQQDNVLLVRLVDGTDPVHPLDETDARRFKAPEAPSVPQTLRDRMAADMWAIGLVALEMFVGDADFTRRIMPIGDHATWMPEYVLPCIKVALPDILIPLFRGLLRKTPWKRWTVRQCLDWITLLHRDNDEDGNYSNGRDNDEDDDRDHDFGHERTRRSLSPSPSVSPSDTADGGSLSAMSDTRVGASSSTVSDAISEASSSSARDTPAEAPPSPVNKGPEEREIPQNRLPTFLPIHVMRKPRCPSLPHGSFSGVSESSSSYSRIRPVFLGWDVNLHAHFPGWNPQEYFPEHKYRVDSDVEDDWGDDEDDDYDDLFD